MDKESINTLLIDKELIDKELINKELIDKELINKELIDKELKEDIYTYSCPITKQIFYEPVEVEHNYKYEKEVINIWFEKSNLNPLTGKYINTTLKINDKFNKDLSKFKQECKMNGLILDIYKPGTYKIKTVESKERIMDTSFILIISILLILYYVNISY